MGIIRADAGKTVKIAYQGENKRQQVAFPLADIMEEFPGGTAVLAILRKGDTDPVPAAITEMDGTDLIWTVTAWECAKDDFIYAQITYAVDEVVAKTKTYRFDVKGSLIVSAAEPETWQDMVGQLVTAAAALQAAIDAYDAMTAEAEGLAAGSAPTAEIDHTGDNPVLKLGIPAGANGYSPSASVSKVGKKATITITDQQGTTTAEISDGTDGADVIDDTAGSGDTGKTWSADKIVGELGEKYEKPAGGIPATDLASAAQTSLEKADTAYQKPAGGIPATDLASGVIPDPTSIIDDTAGAGDTDKTFSADKLVSDHNSLLNAIEGKEDKPELTITFTISEGLESVTADKTPQEVASAYGSGKTIRAYGVVHDEYFGDSKSLLTGFYLIQAPPMADNCVFAGNVIYEDRPYTISVAGNTYDNVWNIYEKKSIDLAYDGTYSAENKRIKNLADPTNAQDAATKSYVDTAKADVDNNKADIIITNASGSIASISDGADDLPIDDMVVQIEPVQSGSGDPSPNNVRPISGWTGTKVTRCGRNLLDNVTPDVVNGYLTTAKQIASNASNRTVIVPCKPNTTYTYTWNRDSITGSDDSGIIGFSEYPIAGTTIGTAWLLGASVNNNGVPKTFTTGSSDKFLAIKIANVNNSDFTETLKKSILELGSTASAYEEYRGQTYPIAFPSEAGTIYGGTLNPVTGELVVDRASVDLGTLNWSYDSQYQRFFTVGLTSVIKKGSSGWILPLCSAYKSAVGVSDDKTISEYATTGYIYIKDTSYTDATAFKTALSGVQLVYELAEPLEYDLDSITITTLLGTNAIWADTGDVSVDYRADTKLYVDRMSASGGITVDTALSSTSTNPVQNKVINTALAAKEPKHNTVSVSGTTPTITGVADTRYICGECSTLTITAPASGCIDVTFTSGSTPTVLTVSSAKTGVSAIKWANGFDPSSLDANTVYEINILDGEYGVVGQWT